MLFSTRLAVIQKGEALLALGLPTNEIDGVQPWLFALATQKSAGAGHALGLHG